MKKETLQNLLHTYFPDWDMSINQARNKLGFSFNFNGQQKWKWFVTGRHTEVRKYAEQEINNLHLPGEMTVYWVCCFYSDYQQHDGINSLTEVKGPPFLEFPCPSSTLSGAWKDSIEKSRDKLMNKYNLRADDDLVGWYWDLKGANELGSIALEEVRGLKLADYYAMAWVCCFLPQGAKWMSNRSVSILERFPQFTDRRQFICSSENPRRRVRAYPFVIDWVEGADAKYRSVTTMWDLQERGIEFGMESDPSGNVRVSLSWRPELVRINELRQAVEYTQRYYRKRMKSTQSTPLHHLVSQFIHRAKVIPVDQRKKSAQVHYTSGDVTFEQLLCEEALRPDVQNRYKEYSTVYHKSSARAGSSLRKIRRLRKEVYDRVRAWLVNSGKMPKLARDSTWWTDVLPQP